DKLDANERLKLIKNSLAGKNLLANTKIYFAHFEAFTKEAFDFVRVLFEEAGLVALSLAYPQSIGNDYIYEKDLQGKFEKLANEYGQNVDIFVCDNPLLPAQEAITRGLYSYEKVKTNNEGYYNIYGGGSITAEVESVAKLIRYYVYKGSSYRDFQIAIGALGKYQQTVEDIFDKYKIPFYIDSTITADQTILGNFIIEFFTTFVTGFGRDNLIDFFSNILVKEKELVKLCQTYAVEGRGRYKQFIEEQNPFAEEFGLLEKAKKAQDFSHVVINLCNKIQDRYDDVLERLRDNGDLKEYNINRQMFEILVGCTQLIEQYSFEEMDSGEYLKKLKLLLSFKQVSSVPTYLDSVMLGDATQSGFEEKPFLVILGGEQLPVVTGDNGLLSDEELKMNGIGKEIEPTIRMINRRNRFKLFNLLTLARDRLFVFYQITNSEGKRNELPAYAKSLNGIFDQTPLNVKGVFFARNPDNENWALLASGLKEKEGDFSFLTREDFIQDADRLLLDGDRVKVTQLESYFVCPFRHFANYGLKLKEIRSAFDPRDLGTLCHKMAELFVEKVVIGGKQCDVNKFVENNIKSVLESEGMTERIDCLEEGASLIGFLKKQMISLLNDIVKEGQKSKFKPKYIEVKFDNLKFGKYKLIGKADRIDEYDNYLRVIDYKTGRTGSLLK
ncbi:MAG: PD-(D/E)XK nuclease family protein, partial [Clostridia bacterium]|nr:PD-(D/E)XK nuclease family protein [Clostridia bacterium]